MKNKNSSAIESLQRQIQSVAFDANGYDLGIVDYPYAKKCSEKRKKLQAEIVRLGGVVKQTTVSEIIAKRNNVVTPARPAGSGLVQSSFFEDLDYSLLIRYIINSE